ncbi:ATP-grasp fold amidoligase family protein [uncultured Senegalimassilia sp.]|uniref:ATP-grasp fold amidoligase family protein n=1 Tax=uncultured Senegalimassilia sp. TaxID=1714350 RepID=UPI0025DAF8D6|nr:ATP-grasp fold amidoligase family protein [uncultured Senegalimassilia sp.]
MNTMVKNAVLAPFNALYAVSPELCLRALFRLKQGYPLNLKEPKTFSEKVQWIKLHDRNPLMPRCADKYEVRGYVEERSCGKYLNELLWHGSDPAQIPFDGLPEKYVVKVTHGSTFNVIADGTEPIDREDVVRRCRRWLKAKFLPCYGEWFYGRSGGVEPSVIVEKYIEADGDDGLDDYKVFVMNGKAVLTLVCTGRTASAHCEDCYDMDWNLMGGCDMGEERSGKAVPKPACFDEMVAAAEKLAAPFSHARVDFFIAGGGAPKLIFGEITFTSGSGFDRFHPRAFDEWLGKKLVLRKPNT